MTVLLALFACSKPSAAPPPAPIATPVSAPEPAPEPAPPELAIVDRPIPFGEDRKRLTVAYLQAHVDPARTDASMAPRMVVLHWTAVNDLDVSWNIFAPVELQGRPDLDDAGRVNVSAHYLVDRDGTIYRLMPPTLVARHVIGLNQVAVGIENVGNEANPLTEAQLEANVALVRHLAQRFDITHVIGHHEYQRMEGHPYFQERDPNYRTVKVDPGDAFVAQARARLADLQVQGPPN